MEGKDLKGDIVGHAHGVYDLYHGVPNLEDAKFIGVFTEEDEKFHTLKVQLRFELKNGKEWSVLLMPPVY